MTIWTFGDSFSKHFEHLPDSWVERTAKILHQDVKSFSKPLSTLEYTFFKFNEERNNIKKNDIVIITITTLVRRWFLKDQPFRVLDLTKEQIESFENYMKYLRHFDEMHKIFLINFLYNVNDLSKKKNLHTIILPNFYDFDDIFMKITPELSNLHIARGRIGIISDQEFRPEIVAMSGIDWFMKSDIRYNHLMKTNHRILSDKIVDNIKNKTTIDLTKDIIQGVLDNRLLTDPIVFKNELFDGAIK